jgi:sigma-B regulation protein RsbU (phosphoserine phosphatase)
MFVSAIVGIADSRSGEVEFCNAGHPAPLVLRPGQPAAALNDADGPPLCVDEKFVYLSQHVTLDPSATLLLVTDGVTEAQNPARSCYGSQRLLSFSAAQPATAEVVCKKLYEDVNRFTEGAPLADDLTIVAVRFNP